MLEGLRGEGTIAELCRREGIAESLYYSWSKEFLEAGAARLAGNTKRQASSGEVDELRQENEQLKQAVAEWLLANRVLKVYLARTAGGATDALPARGEAGEHRAGGDLRPASEADAGRAGCAAPHVLPVV